MAPFWNLKAAQTSKRRKLEARMRQEPGLWGPLDEAWNIHGQDYVPGQASLVHYTTIHAQPWRPTPGDYAYLPNPADDIWLALEREADEAGFHPFDAASPSPEFPAECPGPEAGDLENIPDWDIPWLLDRLFQEAGDTITVSVNTAVRPRCTPADPLWWYAQMTAASRRRPRVSWRLAVHSRGVTGSPRIRHWTGGPLPADPPRTWVLLDRHPDHRRQALALAESLGWPAETREVRFRLRDELAPPWPDVVIAAGRVPARFARRIARRSKGLTRLILVGREAGPVGETQDAAVACRHHRLWPDPRRLDTLLPPSRPDPDRLAGSSPNPFQGRPRPHVTLLAGGSRERYRLDDYTAFEMAARVRRRVKEAGGTLAVVTGPRTGRNAAAMLRVGAGTDAILETRPAQAGDGCLHHADFVIVTGESDTLIAAAVVAGKPLYLYPLPQRWPGLLPALADAAYRRALRDVINDRGSRRPQRGLQYLCARLIQQLWLLPSCDMEILHQSLIDLGLARRFGEPLNDWRPQPWHETTETAERLRRLLGAATAPEPGHNKTAEKPAAAPGIPAAMHGAKEEFVPRAVSSEGN
jgi:mitochondrial fission protein ELM1